MRLSTHIVAALFTLLLSVSASFAVTVSITQSGILDTTPSGPSSSPIATNGDLVIQTTVVDLNQPTTSSNASLIGEELWSDLAGGGLTRVEGTIYQASSANVTVPSMGYTLGLNGIEVQVSKLQVSDFASSGFTQEYALFLEIVSRDQSGDAVVSLGAWETAQDVFALSVPEIIASSDINYLAGVNVLSTSGFIGSLFDPSYDFETIAGSTPPAAVPVPAPFLMLGAALLGLVGFGRRARA